MKPYGTNSKKKNYFNKQRGHWCDCYMCVPVKKESKTAIRKKEKDKLKKELRLKHS